MSDWLAIGDETGNWDQPGAFLGVALVMGRIEDWRKALEARLDGHWLKDRLQTPPCHLPSAYRKAPHHHLIDVFNYWSSQPSGEWALDAPGDDPLRQEVFSTLRWLAEHPRLITLGLWGPGAAMRAALFGSEDSAIALGRAYGLLTALALPFLHPQEDRLLIHPGLRSESRDSRAQQRATLNNSRESQELRQFGYVRGTLSILREETQRHGQMWRGGAVARFDVGTLDYLRDHSSALKTARLDNRLLNVVADLGAGLLRLTSQPGTQGVSLRRDDAWRNVVFHELPEITA